MSVLDLEMVTLKAGPHQARSADALCVMEAVAWVAGERHSGQPACACPVLSALLRTWNDSLPDDDVRTRLLKPLVPLLVHSKATPAVERRRAYLAVDWLARVQAPAWLSLHEALQAHAVILRGLPPLVSPEACHQAQPALAAARAAAWDAAWAAAGDAARDAAWAAAGDAARAAARDAARDAAGTAAGTAAWAAAWDAARDAAWAALAPTVTTLQASALDLVHRMLADGR